MGLRSCWSGVRRWVGLGTGWVERMWLRDERRARRHGAGERRWAWVWLGRDATDGDINSLVRQVDEEVMRLPAPLGIGDLMITVTAWGPRRDGYGETVYLEARQAGDEAAMREDLALREPPQVIAIGHAGRGHLVSRQEWSAGGARDELRRVLQKHPPSRRWRIVQVSLFSVGEAYLKLASRSAVN